MNVATAEHHHPRDEAATRELGRRLAADLTPGSFVALDGPLGAGKTVFVQGLALGLGIPSDVRVCSPTYAYANVYAEGRLLLVHVDLYRVGSIDDLEAIGYRDLFESGGVCAVEWASRVPEALPPSRVHVTIAPLPEGDGRGRRIEIRRT